MMTVKPPLLFIAHRIPYPPNKGDKIRTFNEIRFLSGYFSIDLVALVDDSDDFKYRDRLKTFCRTVHLFGLNRYLSVLRGMLSLVTGASISQGYFGHPGARKKVADLLSLTDYQAVVCFSSPTAGLLPGNFSGKGTRTIMDFCDVDSEKWGQYARSYRGPARFIYGLEARRLRSYEINLSRCFDASVFVSKAEADLFLSLTPYKDGVHAVSNGVDYDFFSLEDPGVIDALEIREGHLPLVLMFPGAMDYHANVQGVAWFSTRVMPQLSTRLEEQGIQCRFDIVGKNPVNEVRSLAENGSIRVTGFVEDIRPYYRAADVVVIPLQVARGIQNKVLEAMAMARTVVATPQAVEGIGAVEDVHYKAAETPEQFTEEILELARSPELAREMGKRARCFIEEKFSWARCLEPLLGIIDGKA